MSQENVEIVRRANAAFNARDIAGSLRFFSSDFEFVDHAAAVGEDAGTGREEFRRLMESWLEAFPDFRAETEEFIDAGDRVVCVTQWCGTGASSRLDYHQSAAEVYSLREREVVRAEFGFADRAAALKAVGLEE